MQKSQPSSNLGVIAPLGVHPQKCGVGLRRLENERMLSSLSLCVNLELSVRQQLDPVCVRVLIQLTAIESEIAN